MATELAKAYVQIVPSAQGIQGSITSLMGGESRSAGESSGQNFASSFAGMAKKALVGLGIGKIITDAIGNASEFETAMAKTSTLFSGTKEEFAGLQNQILQLSGSYGVAATELAEAAYSAESAGVSTEQLGDMLESSAKLAQAGFTDIDTALSATAKTMNAYGDAAMSADKIQKVLIQTQNLGITTVGELGASLANVTPTAAAMGVGFDQIGAAMAQLTASGVQTAQATTQLRSAMTELGKAGTKADKAFREAAKGTEYAEMSFQEAIDAGANLGDVFGLMQEYADASGQSMVDLWGSVEAGNAAMLIASDVEKFNSNLEAMGTDADVVGEAYGKMADTFGSSLSRLKESAANFMTTLFNGGDISGSFDTMLENLGDVGEKLLGWLTTGLKTLGENLPELMAGLLDFGAGILESLAGVDWIELGTTIINGLIGAMGTLGERLVELVGDGISAVANGDIDFASVGTAIYDGITSVLQTSGKWLTELLDAAKAAGEGIDWEGLGSSILGGVLSVLSTIGETLGGLFEKGLDAAREKDWPSVGEAIKMGVNLVLGAGEFLTAAFEGGAELIRSINWQNVGTGIENLIVTGLGGLETLVDTVAGAADRLISSIGWESVGQGIGEVLTAGLDVAEKWITVIGEAGADLVSGIKWTDLGSDISDLLSTGFKGASTLLEDGFTAAHDFIMAIDWAEVGSAVQTGMGDVWSGLTTLLGGALTGLGETAEGVGKGIGKAADAAGSWIANLLNPTDTQTAIEDLKKTMDELDKAISEKQTELESTAKNIGAGILKNLKEDLSPVNMNDIGEKVLTGIEGGIALETPNLAAAVGDVKGIFEAEEGYWSGAGETIMDGVNTGITGKVATIGKTVESVKKGIKTAMEGVAGYWNDTGKAIIDGIVEGVNANAGTLYSVMKQIAYNALAAAKKALGISSPSRVMREQVGRWIPAGIAAGIEQGSGLVTDAMNDLSTGTLQDLTGALSWQGRQVQAGTIAGGGADSSLTERIVDAVKRGLEGATIPVYMNGRALTDEVNRVLGSDYSARRFA